MNLFWKKIKKGFYFGHQKGPKNVPFIWGLWAKLDSSQKIQICCFSSIMTLYSHAKNQAKLMNQYWEKYKKVYFGPKNGLVWAKQDFFLKIRLCHFSCIHPLPSCQKWEKTNEPFLRSCVTDRWTDDIQSQLMYVQSQFYRTLRQGRCQMTI